MLSTPMRQVAEVAPAGIDLRVPVVGQLDRRIGAFGCGDEDQRVAALLVDMAALLDKAELVDEKVERLIQIGDADHGMEIFHGITS